MKMVWSWLALALCVFAMILPLVSGGPARVLLAPHLSPAARERLIDVDDDGQPELLRLTRADGDWWVDIWHRKGRQFGLETSVRLAGPKSAGFHPVDLDGDGRPDLAWRDRPDGAPEVRPWHGAAAAEIPAPRPAHRMRRAEPRTRDGLATPRQACVPAALLCCQSELARLPR